MSDSEHACSSSEDEDYVPEEYDSDEEESGEEEKKKVSSKMATKKTRVRWGGIKLVDVDHNNTEDEDEGRKQDLEEEEILLKQQKEIAAKKEKEDDLWAAFKRDTGMMASNSSKATLSQMPSSSCGKKVSITKTYDFADEAVIVTKTVDKDSLEAKHTKKEETKKAVPNHSVMPVGCVGVKRAGGLSSVLGQIGKKAKLSTLEKSKLDWNMFKEQEGIQEELQNFNKDGYLEKQAFLKRTDERQFEMERDLRQGTKKR